MVRMQDIRLLILDIDGTIAGHNNQVSPRVIQAIQGVKERGIRVAIATGRMFKSAKRFHEVITSDLPIIAYNGAWIQHPADNKVYRKLSVQPEIGLAIFDYLSEEPWRSQLHIQIYHDDELYVAESNDQIDTYEERTGCKANLLKDLREIIEQSPTKLLAVCHQKNISQKLVSTVQKHYPVEQIYCTQSTEFYVEFTSPLATKGQAVKFLTEDTLGLQSENTMAIGDNFNDTEMLQYAGISIAMENAPDNLKKIADYVTSSVEEDGVAQAIAKFLP